MTRRRRKNRSTDTRRELLDHVARTSSQCVDQVLDLIGSERRPLTAREAARATGCSVSAARAALKKLIAQRFVKADHWAGDARTRAKQHHITQRGIEAWEARQRALEVPGPGWDLDAAAAAWEGAGDPLDERFEWTRTPQEDGVLFRAFDMAAFDPELDDYPLAGELLLARDRAEAREPRRFGEEDFAAVRRVWVAPSHRDQGIATRLYELAAREAMQLGVPLASASDRSRGAGHFWAKQQRRGRAQLRRTRATRERRGGSRYLTDYPPPLELNPQPDCAHCAKPLTPAEVAFAEEWRPMGEARLCARCAAPTNAGETDPGYLAAWDALRTRARAGNPDLDLRRLERAAAVGGPRERAQLERALARLRPPPPPAPAARRVTERGLAGRLLGPALRYVAGASQDDQRAMLVLAVQGELPRGARRAAKALGWKGKGSWKRVNRARSALERQGLLVGDAATERGRQVLANPADLDLRRLERAAATGDMRAAAALRRQRSRTQRGTPSQQLRAGQRVVFARAVQYAGAPDISRGEWEVLSPADTSDGHYRNIMLVRVGRSGRALKWTSPSGVRNNLRGISNADFDRLAAAGELSVRAAPTKTKRAERKKNPALAVVGNPVEQVSLKAVKRACGDKAYREAVKRYKQFHDCAPTHAKRIRVPDGKRRTTQRVGVALGRAPETHYFTDSQGSNKHGAHWVHEHPEGREPILVLDPRTGYWVTLPTDPRTRATDWLRD